MALNLVSRRCLYATATTTFARPQFCTVFSSPIRSYVVVRTPGPNDTQPEQLSPSPRKTEPSHLEQLASNLRFPLKHNAKPSFDGISNPLGGTENLPFLFQRTISNRLPVYPDFKIQGHKREFTVIKHISGDIKVNQVSICFLLLLFILNIVLFC